MLTLLGKEDINQKNPNYEASLLQVVVFLDQVIQRAFSLASFD
jgi:hypothetical protein